MAWGPLPVRVWEASSPTPEARVVNVDDVGHVAGRPAPGRQWGICQSLTMVRSYQRPVLFPVTCGGCRVDNRNPGYPGAGGGYSRSYCEGHQQVLSCRRATGTPASRSSPPPPTRW